MWRFRAVVQLLITYFLWLVITQKSPRPFGYETPVILTYILGTSLMRSIVISSRSTDAQNEISTGDLNNYLVKPLNYFRYWLFRDVADKALNILFTVGELGVLFWLLKPPIFLQTNPVVVVEFIGVTILAMVMYFYFSMIISMSTFWWVEGNGWPQRYLSFVVMEFLAGGLFPLDILPPMVFKVVRWLPPTYFLFTPLQVYLGRVNGGELIQLLGIMVSWTIVLWLVARLMWQKGLKVYGAYGR